MRIEGYSQTKDKKTNGEMSGQVLLISLFQRDAAEASLGCEKTVIEFRRTILQRELYSKKALI